MDIKNIENTRKPALKIKPGTSAFSLLQKIGDKGAGTDFIELKIPLFLNEYRFRNALHKLRKENLLIEKDKKIKLSEEGLTEYARIKVEQSNLLPEGIDCIVVFDIPESKRKIRTFLGKLLVSLAFLRIQKSVWISPFDNAEPLCELLKRLGLKKWVRIFTGKEE